MGRRLCCSKKVTGQVLPVVYVSDGEPKLRTLLQQDMKETLLSMILLSRT